MILVLIMISNAIALTSHDRNRTYCKVISLFVIAFLVVCIATSDRGSYQNLAHHDEKIALLRQQLGVEINNPYFWAELGELYFDRHRKWKLGGLFDSLECFTWADNLIVAHGGDDVYHSAQFAMTLQRGTGFMFYYELYSDL